MKIHVVSNFSNALIQAAQAAERADHILAMQAAKDTEQFVPALTGSLTNRTRVVGGKIIYPGPYAHYLYVGKLFVDPKTGSSWASKGAAKTETNRDLVFTKKMHGQAQDHWFEASKALNMGKWLRVYGKAVKQALGK